MFLTFCIRRPNVINVTSISFAHDDASYFGSMGIIWGIAVEPTEVRFDVFRADPSGRGPIVYWVGGKGR